MTRGYSVAVALAFESARDLSKHHLLNVTHGFSVAAFLASAPCNALNRWPGEQARPFWTWPVHHVSHAPLPICPPYPRPGPYAQRRRLGALGLIRGDAVRQFLVKQVRHFLSGQLWLFQSFADCVAARRSRDQRFHPTHHPTHLKYPVQPPGWVLRSDPPIGRSLRYGAGTLRNR